jgi:hypothetical protein
VRNIPPVIFHPLQPFPASFFITHEISSPSSSSHRQSCLPREFTFHPFFSTTKVTPRFALIHWIFLMPATPLPECRRYLPVLCFPRPGTWLLCFRKFWGVLCKISKVFFNSNQWTSTFHRILYEVHKNTKSVLFDSLGQNSQVYVMILSWRSLRCGLG